MSIARTYIPAPPEEVFGVLANPDTYGEWVVGAQTIRWSDTDWPRPGSRLGHRLGVGPLRLDDTTRVVDCAPPRLLKLQTRAWPLGETTVELRLRGHDGGTAVEMEQNPSGGPLRWIDNRLLQKLNAWRDRECLSRIERLVT